MWLKRTPSKRKPSFRVSEYTNNSGSTSWRVSGFIEGRRIRRNFDSPEEAEAERRALQVLALQNQPDLQRVVTRLSDEQVREAEAVFQRLKGQPRSLQFYVDYALANYKEPELQKPLAEAVQEYVTFKEREYERGLLSISQMRSIRFELGHFKNSHPVASVSEFTPAVLIHFLERRNPALKTINNRRGILSTFFRYALRMEWLVTNPIDKTEPLRIRHRRGSAETISAAQAAELMEHVEGYRDGAMVPYFAICLFAGIRPCIQCGEISKLKPENIRLSTRTIHIEPEVSKVRMKRNVDIQPNLAQWLAAYPLDRYPILPVNAKNMRKDIFTRFEMSHDILRHTFISMFVGKFRSMGEAALQAGNSESIIRKHYLDLKDRDEADAFFAILPKKQVPAAAPMPDPQPLVLPIRRPSNFTARKATKKASAR
ncbi:MAG: site-specific integrase [Opitutales bacterium]|jgi:integrase